MASCIAISAHLQEALVVAQSSSPYLPPVEEYQTSREVQNEQVTLELTWIKIKELRE